MSQTTIQNLVTRARKITMTTYERREQRRSFVYGNTHIENERVTREIVDQVDEQLEKDESEQAKSK